MIFCTVTTNKHLHLAIVMARSIKRIDPQAKIVMGYVEEHAPSLGSYTSYFDHIVLAKDLGFPNFYQHIFKHNPYEGAASCKARLIQYVYGLYKNENTFIYIDSDTKIFSPLQELQHSLLNNPIVLSPHFLTPNPRELITGMSGVYNSGLIGLRRSEEAKQFLLWWGNWLDRCCFFELQRGVYGDQKFLDFAPSYFNVFILKHPGYNVAEWNLFERNITFSENGQYMVNDQPLRIFHFSQIVSFWNKYETIDPNPYFQTILREYKNELFEVGFNPKIEKPWSYGFFYSGEPIQMNSRLIYRDRFDLFARIGNPFMRSNHFFEKRNKQYYMRKQMMARKRKRKKRVNKILRRSVRKKR